MFLYFVVGYNCVFVVEYLLYYGVDVYVKDKGGLVFFYNVCFYGYYEVVEFLVRYGVFVNVVDLWKFIFFYEVVVKGKYEICKFFLKYGVDLIKKNRDGNIFLDLVKEGDIDIQDLLRGDVVLLDVVKKGCLVRVQKFCIFENINCRDIQGRNLIFLYLVVGYNNLEVVEYFLEYGVDVNVQDKGGLIFFYNVVFYGYVDIVVLLIKYNMCVNVIDKWVFIFFYEVVQKGRMQLCVFFLVYGVDFIMKNQEGQMFLDLVIVDDIRVLLIDVMFLEVLFICFKFQVIVVSVFLILLVFIFFCFFVVSSIDNFIGFLVELVVGGVFNVGDGVVGIERKEGEVIGFDMNIS